MLAVALVSALALSGCKREESALIGTWVDGAGHEKQFRRNGNWEISVNGVPNVRGTYTVDGGTITRRMTHLHGGLFDGLEPAWYSERELSSAINRNVEVLFPFRILLPFERQTEIYTYSISGNTVTFTHTGTDWDETEVFTQTFTRR